MKLKYKKVILLTTMSTMGIGLLTLSLSQDSTKAEESLNANTKIEVSTFAEDMNSQTLMANQELTEEVPTLSPTPTAIPTPTPIPVYDLEEDSNSEITTLFKDYYAAKNSSDIKKLKSILSNPDKVATEEQLQSKTEYIDDYRNIMTYIKQGIEEGTYIAYVYHEIKITGINTPAPGLAKFYVVTDEGKLKIFNGDMDEDLATYFDERDNDADVQALSAETDSKGEEAKNQDQDLKEFWEEIDKMANEKAKKAKKAD